MPTYWVNIPDVDLIEYGDDGTRATAKEKEAFLQMKIELKNLFGEHYGIVFKTTDLEEAKEMAKKIALIEKKFYKVVGDVEDADNASFSSQPECPECGYLGKFSDAYCSRCGTELTEKEIFDVDIEKK